MEFLYDHTGVFAVKYADSTYIYRKDAQGNIVALLDNTGATMVKYKYDAWGNCKVLNATGTEITDATHIGILNPFRYRSYYYDTETKLYFLKTRYYDPEIGRFITIDDLSYLDPETVNGLNLYAYCANNPVNRIDQSGTFAISTAIIIAMIAGAIAGGVAGGVYAYNQASLAGATGWSLFGQTMLGVFCGGILGAAIGGMIGFAAPYIGAFLSSTFPLVAPVMLDGAVGYAVIGTVTGAQIAVAGGVAISAIIDMHGEPNSTVKQGGSTGKYDENGNLISRQDTTGRSHFIKEYNGYFLPHTHVYKWRLIDGVWRIVQKIILPW